MTASPVKILRPAAAVIAFVLVAGVVQVAPASAAPSEASHAAVSITSVALYSPRNENPGPPGDSIDAPADAGTAPATMRVSVVVTNVGTDPLHHIKVSFPHMTNGSRDSFRCDEVSSQPPFGDPDLTLDRGHSLFCVETVSTIMDGITHESSVSVTAIGQLTGTSVSDTAQVWAEADPPGPPPPPQPAAVGHRVWLDTNRNRTWEEGEPGIPGAHLEIDTGCCQTLPEGPFFAATTTDEHGIYHFRNLKPAPVYILTLYLYATPVFDDLAPWSFPLGTSGLGDGSLILTRGFSADTDESINFGFVPKVRMSMSIDAPTTAIAGTTIEVKGHPSLPDRPSLPGDWGSILEFRDGGTIPWTKVSGTYSDSSGDVHTEARVTRSGWFRYWREGDNIYTAPGVSREAHILVRTAPVALTAAAPATVRSGASVTVTGTITRAGQPFKTGRTTLEYASARTWTTVADVRSTDGTLKATVQPARTGSYRYRYAGDSTTAPGTSPGQQVVVSPAITKSPSPRPPR